MKLHFSEVKNSLLDVKVRLRDEVYNWGRDNAYPSTMEYLLSSSVTAKNCVDKSAKSVIGKGVKNGHIIVNKKGQTLNDVIRTLSREYVKHNNAFISIGYNALFEVSSIETIPSKNVRVGERDDSGYSGKYVVYANWDGADGKVDSDAFQIVDKYNPNKEVIASQVEKAGNIKKYKGQVIHIQKYLNEIYSLADGDCVILDMIAEINAGEFKQKGTTDGFLNTKIMVTKPFNSDEERRAFKNDLDSIRGAKNSNSVILLESPDASSDLAENILLQDLTSTHDDKIFSYTESSVEKAICKAFNVPIVLVNPSENGLFGNSGEMYRVVKDIMWEEAEESRQKIEEAITSIMNNYKNPIEGKIDILRTLDGEAEQKISNAEENKTKEVQ